MTKKLTNQDKKKRKDERRASKQQKATSTTAVTVQQPKPEAPPPAEPVNLCDSCAYEYGECEGVPKFAQEDDPISEGADRVVACPAHVNVDAMPTADELAKKDAAVDIPEIIIVCSGSCGRTTEGMTFETKSGEFQQIDESGVPEWTCQECLDNAAHADGDNPPVETTADQEDEEDDGAVFVQRAEPIIRPDPKRFAEDLVDYGACPSCETPLKRTAYSRFVDAVRCTNPRCRSYRSIVKTLPTGVK